MTKKKKPEDIVEKAYREAVKKFREKYYHELDKTIQAFIEIRDSKDPKITPKHKIDSSVAIAKMLGSYSADKVAQASASPQAVTPTLSPTQMAKLESEVEEILGRTRTAENPPTE